MLRILSAMWLGTIISPRLRRGFVRSALERSAPRRIASFTLVEMLIAMAITLVMMGAVVTLFANISNSVKNRRATIEMSGQLRRVRNALQQDLQGATCPGVTWQRPESNHGYIEIIEGQYREGYASNLIDGIEDAKSFNPEIDHTTSILPSSDTSLFSAAHPDWVTDGAGLGDYDDILMLTVRNEHEPFVGRMPAETTKTFKDWSNQTIQSQLAEVVWFAIENPATSEIPPGVTGFFGEPGMRTIYRRTFLIAPWVNPLYDPNIVDPKTGLVPAGYKPVPGLLRVLSTQIKQQDIAQALAALVAFQDKYDLSVRVEWDHDLRRWKIIANTLADLTKRENRFGHYGYYFRTASPGPARIFPYARASFGGGYTSDADLEFVTDPDPGQTPATKAKGKGRVANKSIFTYTIDDAGSGYIVRPFVYPAARSDVPATAQAMLSDDGRVVRIIHGPVPLWGDRRGQDVMMTDALAFDLRVYDPGAPLFATRKLPYDASKGVENDLVLNPTDPGWLDAYMHNDNMKPNGTGAIGSNNTAAATVTYLYVGQGAYVDLGYGYNPRYTPPTYPGPPGLPFPKYSSTSPADFSSSASPWFFCSGLNAECARLFQKLSSSNVAFVGDAGALRDVYGNMLAPGYAVYDTWSFHYENDGVDEDASGLVDQGTNGLDDVGVYPVASANPQTVKDTRLGVDDVGERETTPPYDKPLRGMQVVLRAYERDSRSIRQVRVTQHFMPE